MPGVRTQIVRIGNSRGIRIPKNILEQCHLTGDVIIEPQDGQLVVRPARTPRSGWDEAFETMAKQGDDVLLDSAPEEVATDWEFEEWEW